MASVIEGVRNDVPNSIGNNKVIKFVHNTMKKAGEVIDFSKHPIENTNENTKEFFNELNIGGKASLGVGTAVATDIVIEDGEGVINLAESGLDLTEHILEKTTHYSLEFGEELLEESLHFLFHLEKNPFEIGLVNGGGLILIGYLSYLTSKGYNISKNINQKEELKKELINLISNQADKFGEYLKNFIIKAKNSKNIKLFLTPIIFTLLVQNLLS